MLGREQHNCCFALTVHKVQSYQLIDARDAIYTRSSVEKTTALQTHTQTAASSSCTSGDMSCVEREDTAHKCVSVLLVGEWKTLTSWPFIYLARDQPRAI
jgi:hypothetical protein